MHRITVLLDTDSGDLPVPDSDAARPSVSCAGAADQVTQWVTVVPPAPLLATPPPRASMAPIFGPLSEPGGPALGGSRWSDWDGRDDDEVPTGGRRPPRVGDTVQGFKLVGELGRGAFARVYLAQQEALAGREVALKVTLRPTREAERLARLQHTNIVPVYSVHGDGAVQLICMPFLGRVTIADLLRAHKSDRSSRGHRRTTVRAARSTTTDSKSASASDGRPAAPRVPVWTWDADAPPPIVGDPLAVVQALAQLAAGLAHAHARGILHLDLKPANVLLADTGEPMLLDFNLSFDANRPDRDVVGGTMPYMAIEQLLDMRNRGAGALDERTDLYALGAMAFEMLTGELPFAAGPKGAKVVDAQIAARRQGPPSVRALNPAVTPAVEAIVRKLLAADPADRYQTADQLRTDLERHLRDLPLRFAREGSVAERLGKWRRRNPGVVVRLMAAALIGLALGLGGVVHQRAEATARTGAAERARGTRAALDAVRLDLVLCDDPAVRARGTKRAEELLAAYGCPDDPKWQQRQLVRQLPEAERAELVGDFGELLFLLAQVKMQDLDALPGAERRQRAADAWELNRSARSCYAANAVPPVVDRLAALIAPLAGEEFTAPDLPEPAEVVGARARFLEAAFALRSRRYATAAPLLESTIADRPNHGAAQFCLAHCLHQLGQYARALERYDMARVLLPKDPRPAYCRGLIYAVRRKPALAEAEFSKALALDPGHADAYRNRGLVRHRLAKTDEGRASKADAVRAKLEAAEKDYTTALDRGAPAFQIYLLRAAVRDGRDPAGARADRAAVKALEPESDMDYLVRGTTNINSDPNGALADLRKAAELNPRSIVAFQNQAHVLADKLKDLNGALEAASQAAELYPEFAPARAGRAVVLARLGRRDEAHKEIEQAQLLSDEAQVTYQAACVYSLTSTRKVNGKWVNNPDDADKAIALLKQAIRDGFTGLRELSSDPDLDAIRKHQEFQGLFLAAKSLLK